MNHPQELRLETHFMPSRSNLKTTVISALNLTGTFPVGRGLGNSKNAFVEAPVKSLGAYLSMLAVQVVMLVAAHISV